MKRIAITLGILLLVGAVAYPVLARGPGWGRGDHRMGNWGGGDHHMMGYRGPGPGYGPQAGRNYGNMTDEQRTQLDKLNQKFYDETEQIRNEIWTKSGELDALLNSSDPNAEKAKALQKEISDMRAKMAEARTDFELEARKITPEGYYGRGYSRGYGSRGKGFGPGRGYGRMGGYGPGSCWN